MLPMDVRISKNERIPWRIIEGDGILVDTDKGEVIHLNPVAAFIWQLIDGKITVSEIIKEICSEFEVNEAIAKKDVLSFTEKLLERGVIEWLGKAE